MSILLTRGAAAVAVVLWSAVFATAVSLGPSPGPVPGDPHVCAGFNGDLSGWGPGGFPSSGFSGYSSTDTPFEGSGSLSFHSVNSGGDTFSPVFPIAPGPGYRISLAYRTRGGGGYLGVNEYADGGGYLSEQWLLGDGTYQPVQAQWEYRVGNQDPSALNVWRTYTVDYTPNPSAASFQIKAEQFIAGLNPDPVNNPIFFDSICVEALTPQGKVSARGTVTSTGLPQTVTFSAANDCDKAASTRPSIVEWLGNRFTKTSVTESLCLDDPAVPGTPPSGFDTQTGKATGTLQVGGTGTLEWKYIDGGPGAHPDDKVQFTVKNSGGTQILTVDQQTPDALGNTPGGVWTFGL